MNRNISRNVFDDVKIDLNTQVVFKANNLFRKKWLKTDTNLTAIFLSNELMVEICLNIVYHVQTLICIV